MSGRRQTPSACVVGSINVDVTYRVSRLPAFGETVLSSDRTVAPGGKGANQAAAMASLGGRVCLVGCTGEDVEATIATASLAGRGVDLSDVGRVADAPTGTAVIVVSEDGENLIVVHPGANHRVDPELVAKHLAAHDHAVVFAQLEINLDAVLSAVRHRGDAAFILNPAPMPADPTVLCEILDSTDVLVPNRVELGRLAGQATPTDPDAIDSCVAALGFPRPVLVTLGSGGVAVYERGCEGPARVVPGVAVDTIDTSGAGDAFCGALGHYLAIDGDLMGAARAANRVAARSTTQRGAQLV